MEDDWLLVGQLAGYFEVAHDRREGAVRIVPALRWRHFVMGIQLERKVVFIHLPAFGHPTRWREANPERSFEKTRNIRTV